MGTLLQAFGVKFSFRRAYNYLLHIMQASFMRGLTFDGMTLYSTLYIKLLLHSVNL
jgi:hypothetical protein